MSVAIPPKIPQSVGWETQHEQFYDRDGINERISDFWSKGGLAPVVLHSTLQELMACGFNTWRDENAANSVSCYCAEWGYRLLGRWGTWALWPQSLRDVMVTNTSNKRIDARLQEIGKNGTPEMPISRRDDQTGPRTYRNAVPFVDFQVPKISLLREFTE